MSDSRRLVLRGRAERNGIVEVREVPVCSLPMRFISWLAVGAGWALAGACGGNGSLGTDGGMDAAAIDAPPPCVPADPPAADCADPCFDDEGPRLVVALEVADLDLPAPPQGSLPVRVSLFYTVAPQASSAWTAEEAAAQMRQLVISTDAILAQCGLHVQVMVAQVIALPARLLELQGNQEGSYGGHPPEGTENPDLFDYQQNERLTAESLELFTYGKSVSPGNAIDAYTVRSIIYYANQQLTGAGGLSYPPNIYHHPDDYPYRNSVLLVPTYGACGDLPGAPGNRTLAHEIGHMLLNSGGHSTTPGNLMANGTSITIEQCDVMRANLAALYGEAEVPDPGPPPTGFDAGPAATR